MKRVMLGLAIVGGRRSQAPNVQPEGARVERFGLLAALAIGCATVAGAQQPSTAVRGHIEFVDGTTAEFAQALRFAGSDGLSVEYEHSQRFIPLSSLVSVDIQTWECGAQNTVASFKFVTTTGMSGTSEVPFEGYFYSKIVDQLTGQVHEQEFQIVDCDPPKLVIRRIVFDHGRQRPQRPAAAAAMAPAVPAQAAAPAGATAKCKDGTYSMSIITGHECSGHGGIAEHLGGAAAAAAAPAPAVAAPQATAPAPVPTPMSQDAIPRLSRDELRARLDGFVRRWAAVAPHRGLYDAPGEYESRVPVWKAGSAEAVRFFRDNEATFEMVDTAGSARFDRYSDSTFVTLRNTALCLPNLPVRIDQLSQYTFRSDGAETQVTTIDGPTHPLNGYVGCLAPYAPVQSWPACRISGPTPDVACPMAAARARELDINNYPVKVRVIVKLTRDYDYAPAIEIDEATVTFGRGGGEVWHWRRW